MLYPISRYMPTPYFHRACIPHLQLMISYSLDPISHLASLSLSPRHKRSEGGLRLPSSHVPPTFSLDQLQLPPCCSQVIKHSPSPSPPHLTHSQSNTPPHRSPETRISQTGSVGFTLLPPSPSLPPLSPRPFRNRGAPPPSRSTLAYICAQESLLLHWKL